MKKEKVSNGRVVIAAYKHLEGKSLQEWETLYKFVRNKKISNFYRLKGRRYSWILDYNETFPLTEFTRIQHSQNGNINRQGGI